MLCILINFQNPIYGQSFALKWSTRRACEKQASTEVESSESFYPSLSRLLSILIEGFSCKFVDLGLSSSSKIKRLCSIRSRISKDNMLYPNPSVGKIVEDYQRHYYFIGRILGKALYENLLVELPLAEFFLSKLAGKHSDVDIHQLASLDPVLHRFVTSILEFLFLILKNILT